MNTVQKPVSAPMTPRFYEPGRVFQVLSHQGAAESFQPSRVESGGRNLAPGQRLKLEPYQQALARLMNGVNGTWQPKPLLQAAGLIYTGLLLHRLPQRTIPMVRTLLPVDWKVYARVILGIAAVQKINKAFDWQPPPWLGGMQAVAVITPVAMKLSKSTLKHVAILAPVVGAVVQAASELNQRIAGPLEEKANIPPWVTRLGIAAGMTLVGLRVSKWMGLGGAAAMTCIRGCSPGSIICLSEVGEMLAGMKTWVRRHQRPTSETMNVATSQERR